MCSWNQSQLKSSGCSWVSPSLGNPLQCSIFSVSGGAHPWNRPWSAAVSTNFCWGSSCSKVRARSISSTLISCSKPAPTASSVLRATAGVRLRDTARFSTRSRSTCATPTEPKPLMLSPVVNHQDSGGHRHRKYTSSRRARVS
ncbi:uncharacterized protein LOC129002245 [Macrosteles quadrilineatus]|uniref:uncharacterized protein LOC128994987 n=1 Tax=Macrosteles quadrilineatus TaxID=74068 RepID=UPI0023E1B6B2|nr:uncharacterized protein LOC128994987 [Macrosteles quadrilineatus]XP_054285884.1 uncharacterized protein LOC129002245 [Macrosteles quadrilineatus]